MLVGQAICDSSTMTTNTLNLGGRSRDYRSEAVATCEAATDRQLLRRVAQGDEEALGILYQRHSRSLYNYLLRLIHEPALAEDLLQEVFVAAWQGAGRFRGRSKVTTWLFRIAHNQAVSWLRCRKRECTLEKVADLAVEGSPAEQMMGRWRADRIQAALEQLSPKHRAVLELAFYHELSYQDIAEVVGCPVGTVKSRVSYARHYLQEALDELGVDYPQG